MHMQRSCLHLQATQPLLLYSVPAALLHPARLHKSCTALLAPRSSFAIVTGMPTALLRCVKLR